MVVNMLEIIIELQIHLVKGEREREREREKTIYFEYMRFCWREKERRDDTD